MSIFVEVNPDVNLFSKLCSLFRWAAQNLMLPLKRKAREKATKSPLRRRNCKRCQ
jgi:hypothetical protein